MAKVALLVGVSEYEPGLNPLPAAVKDIEAMRRVLSAPDLGGFDEVKALGNLDSQTMQYEFETLFSSRSKDDLVVLFFSGHGIKDDSGRLYFAARNTQKNAKNELIRSTAVPASFLHEVMNGSRAKRQAIILDCCFSGAFDPALIARDDSSVDLQGQLGAEGRVVLTSSSSTQYSFEEQGSDLSIYTRYLVEGIETGAGDLGEDGKVSMRELHEYAALKVRETAPNMTPKMITLKDMGFEIFLSKAKIADPRLSYRRKAEQYASRGEISRIGRTILDTLSTQLGLSTEETTAIEAEVLQPYRQRVENLQRYRRDFVAAIEDEYPLSEATQAELRDLCEVLGLRGDDISLIEAEETAKKTAVVREAYSEKLQRYKQEFEKALQAEYPFSEYVRIGLRNFQQSLGLQDDDVKQIETPLIQQKEAEQQRQQQEALKQAEAERQQQAKQQEDQRNLERYEQEFRRAIKAEYPLSQPVQEGLKQLQQNLGLTIKDIERIKQPLLEQREAEFRHQQEAERLRRQQEAERLQAERQREQEYQQKLQRYEQEFSRAIRASFPVDNYAREGLKNFQQALDLKDEYIARLEAPLLKTREAEYQKQQAEKLRQQQEAARLEQQEAERLREQQRRHQEESERRQAESPPVQPQYRQEKIDPGSSAARIPTNPTPKSQGASMVFGKVVGCVFVLMGAFSSWVGLVGWLSWFGVGGVFNLVYVFVLGGGLLAIWMGVSAWRGWRFWPWS